MHWTSRRRSISLHPSKNGGRSNVAQNFKVRVSRFLDTSSTTQVAQISVKHRRPSGSSWTKRVWSPGLLRERQFEEVLLELGWWKVPNWECLFCSSETRTILIGFTLMTSKWLERSRIWLQCGRIWWNLWILTKPTSFLDHVYLGCTQRECKPNAISKKEYREMFESRISATATEKLPGLEETSRKSGCMVLYCELANKKVEQIKKVSSPCLDDHLFRQEELESVG